LEHDNENETATNEKNGVGESSMEAMKLADVPKVAISWAISCCYSTDVAVLVGTERAGVSSGTRPTLLGNPWCTG
jgi:hypothetical protein